VAKKKSGFKLPNFKKVGKAKSGGTNKKGAPLSFRRILRGPLFWIVAALFAVSIFGQISTGTNNYTVVDTSVILNELSQDKVESAVVIDRDQKIKVILKSGQFVDGAQRLEASYVVGQEQLIIALLTSNPPPGDWNVEVPTQSFFVSLILSLLPILLIIFLLLLFMGGGQGGKVFSFGRSRAKLKTKETPTNTFADVAGSAGKLLFMCICVADSL
jgi:cell division protease FtsH